MKKFCLSRSAIATNLKCNFKCKLCGAYAPYYKSPAIYNVETIQKSIEEYFRVVDYVDKFTITGGEPMLNKDLPKILRFLLNYENYVGCFEIITNGSISATTELLAVCKKFKSITFLIDDYGTELSKKVKELEADMNRNHIPYQTRIYYGPTPYCGGWVDYGDLTQKWFTLQDTKNIFDSCIQHKKLDFCFTIVDGKMFPCSVTRRCMELGIVTDENTPYINLFDTNLSIDEKRKKITNIYDSPFFHACAYCNGFSENSKRYPPAEQL